MIYMPFARRQKDIYLHFICFHCFAYFLLFIKNSHFIVLLRKNAFYAHIIFYCFAHKLFIHTLMPQNRFIGYVLLLQTSILKATVFILSEFPSRIFISVDTCNAFIWEYCSYFEFKESTKTFPFYISRSLYLLFIESESLNGLFALLYSAKCVLLFKFHALFHIVQLHLM